MPDEVKTVIGRCLKRLLKTRTFDTRLVITKTGVCRRLSSRVASDAGGGMSSCKAAKQNEGMADDHEVAVKSGTPRAPSVEQTRLDDQHVLNRRREFSAREHYILGTLRSTTVPKSNCWLLTCLSELKNTSYQG